MKKPSKAVRGAVVGSTELRNPCGSQARGTQQAQGQQIDCFCKAVPGRCGTAPMWQLGPQHTGYLYCDNCQQPASCQADNTTAAHLLPDTNRRTGCGRPLRSISCSISHAIQAPMLWPNSAYTPCLSAAQSQNTPIGTTSQGVKCWLQSNETC